MTADLERFIAKVPAHVAPRTEPTLFALGGRGHYENATSDLLAFFLRPDGDHGLGPTFLRAFLDCIPAVDPLQFSAQGVVVYREQAIPEGRIDIVVQGCDWCLIIENKHHAPLNNPLDAYERYATRLCNARRRLLAVLSPEGATAAGWSGVSYGKFCTAARRHLAATYFGEAKHVMAKPNTAKPNTSRLDS